jgi:hypothetical protein
MVTSTMASSDFSCSLSPDFACAYTGDDGGCGHRPHEISLVPSPTVTTFRSPYAGEFFEAAHPDSSPLPWPSPSVEWLGTLFC